MAYDSVEIMESGRAAVPAGLISETLIAHSEVHESYLSRDNYRGFKLSKHVMKMSELAAEMQIRKSKGINDMQLEFIPGCGTTNDIFITSQLQGKFLAKNKNQ